MGAIETSLAADTEILAEDTSISTTDTIITPGVEDLSVQLNDLYKEVGRNLNIDYMYVKILHLLAGGKAIYADKRPNIYTGLTVESMDAPFDIEGALQKYSAEAPWVLCPDEDVQRPNKYYMPDAAYSVTSEVVKLMNQRYYADRGQMTPYFEALSLDVKTNVIFCEAVLEYIGSSREAIESFYSNYESILYEKEKDENVITSNGDGTFDIKDKFKKILVANNISDERDLEVLSLILSFDSKLAASDNPDSVKDDYVIPYKIDYTSRENMMLAAMSVIGKVRYVWGGGHLGTSTIDGINPSWEPFYNSYSDVEGEPGYDRCIKPSSCWCPIHGEVESANGCLDKSKSYYNINDYIDDRKDVMDTSELEDEKYGDFMNSNLDFEHGVVGHRIDGLDCSGYASWVYNQISTKTYDSGATAFISSGGLKKIPYGNNLLPGDVFSWGDHIVINIGAVRNGSKAYVITESSPNMVKFGVMYYGDANKSDVNSAIEIAREANDLIGKLPISEKTHIYNMDSLGYIKDENGEVTGRYAEIGRLPISFLDENIVISEYNKKIKDMTAKEIIQYVINRIGVQYISGIDTYDGEVFDTSKIRTITLDENILTKNEEKVQEIQNTDIEEVVTLTSDLTKGT